MADRQVPGPSRESSRRNLVRVKSYMEAETSSDDGEEKFCTYTRRRVAKDGGQELSLPTEEARVEERPECQNKKVKQVKLAIFWPETFSFGPKSPVNLNKKLFLESLI